MSLLDAVRAGVKVADQVTKPLQATVGFRHYVSSNWQGEKIYVPPVSQPPREMKAIVDWKQRQLRTTGGILSVSRSAVMFLDVNEVSAATGGEGIGDEDVIILPDGTTGPILDMSGFIDAGTDQPIATEVFIG